VENIKKTLKEWNVRVWTGFSWLRMRPGGNFYEHDNETSGSVRGGEFLDHVSDYQIIKKDPVPRSLLI
jgi:hypothetical protein